MAVTGIDLGGTKACGALFDAHGNIICKESRLLDGRTGKAVGELVCSIAAEMSASAGSEPIEAVSVCVPGIANAKTDTVWAPNIAGWEQYPLKQQIEAATPGVPVVIESDRTCCILGETWKGAAQGAENAVFIVVGTGIGMGILIDGHIINGHAGITGAAGWLALNMLYEDDYPQFGCFESNASGNGIARCARNALASGNYSESILNKYVPEKITASDVFGAYEAGDALAASVTEKAIKMWGMAAANVISLLNPEIIVWGGGIFGPAVQFLPRIKEEAMRWAQPVAAKQTRFAAAQLGSDAALYGTARLALMNTSPHKITLL